MENIGSSNVYMKLPDLKRVCVDDCSSSLTKGKNKQRKLPHWTRLSLTNSDDDEDDDDDEKAKYADWTLDVTVSNNNNNNNDDDNNASSDVIVVSYLVHKYSLGLQSEYFDSIFRCCDSIDDEHGGGGFSESHQKRSAIQLPASGVVTIDHFEILLDYLYTDKLVVDPDNAIAMVYFSDYFGINLLQDQAQSFIRESITTEINSTATTQETLEMQKLLLAAFYKDAKVLAMEELQEAIVYECAGNPRLMISKDIDKQFWCRVFDARKFHPPTELSTKLWSISVAHFIGLHYSNIIDRGRFNELTCITSLPSVSADVAIFLIEQEQRMFTGAENEEITQKKDDDKNLTCLQRRCIDALIDSDTGSWKVPKPRTLQGKLRLLPPCVLESLLLCTMVERKKPPTQNTDRIRVSGAGSEVVNGIYTKQGTSQGCPMYSRLDYYEEDDVEYSIYKYRDGHFYISRDEEVDFYVSTNREEGDFSLDIHWELCMQGTEPLPAFQFV